MADYSRDDKEGDKYKSLDELLQEDKKLFHHRNDDKHRDGRRNRERERRRSNSYNKSNYFYMKRSLTLSF